MDLLNISPYTNLRIGVTIIFCIHFNISNGEMLRIVLQVGFETPNSPPSKFALQVCLMVHRSGRLRKSISRKIVLLFTGSGNFDKILLRGNFLGVY